MLVSRDIGSGLDLLIALLSLWFVSVTSYQKVDHLTVERGEKSNLRALLEFVSIVNKREVGNTLSERRSILYGCRQTFLEAQNKCVTSLYERSRTE